MPSVPIPALTGVLETSLYVDDLIRSERFYVDVMGFKTMVGDPRFRAMNVAGSQVLLLFKKGASTEPIAVPGVGTIPPHDGDGHLHVAWGIPTDALAGWEARLAQHGVAIESRVTWPRGGVSIYFRDPDLHVLELLTPGVWPIY